MDMQNIIDRAEQNIRTALEDYRRYTSRTEELDDVSSAFIHNLARDSSLAKQSLRELFSKSPVWDANIDALVINGTRTHNPDYVRIKELAQNILWKPLTSGNMELADNVRAAILFFADEYQSEADREYRIACINKIAPKAYAPTKKPSRVFKAICTALGVADETAGSDFQRNYAQFADELNAKKIGFKLYVSINPAHFLTMSNPKCDSRGNTLTSCHSFNSTEYEYNNGCSGYARDTVSFIVFTVADPAQPETLNNRKTTRQVFAYRPGSGLLMQSRMYNTSGGVYGAAENSKLYRDLVQREISLLENMPNLWNTYPSVKEGIREYVEEGEGFGGYADWTYENFDGHISFRKDCGRDSIDALEVGTWGLCISCGCETNHGLYCDDCDHDNDSQCDDCEEWYNNDDLYIVYDGDGHEYRVCDSCRDDNYIYCEHCERYVHRDYVNYIDGMDVCDDCRDEYYEECDVCGEWHHHDSMTDVINNRGNEVYVCDRCRDEHYCYCDECGEYHPYEETMLVYTASGNEEYRCEDCRDGFEICPHCRETVEIREDGTCPHCGAVIEEDEEEAE